MLIAQPSQIPISMAIMTLLLLFRGTKMVKNTLIATNTASIPNIIMSFIIAGIISVTMLLMSKIVSQTITLPSLTMTQLSYLLL